MMIKRLTIEQIILVLQEVKIDYGKVHRFFG